MVGGLLSALALAPLAAVVGCLLLRHPRSCEALNVAAGAVSFGCALPLPFLVDGREMLFLGDYVIIDRAAAWVVLCTSIVYLLASIYAVGYMRLLDEDERLFRFYALFAGFGLTTLVGPLMNSVGIYWIAIELTTFVSTFLVAFERAAESMEAAWKYIMIVSAGISLALLGTVLFYWAGSFVLGPTYQMTWAALTGAAPKMNPVLLVLAFLLVLVGFGTKVGLAPMHSWLPDAHSESPAPVSAMLSGALLNTAMIGIVRFLSITRAADLGRLPQLALVAFGALSLLVGALFIVRQHGIKRLMAYSSIEHMGVVALGFGFGGPLGVGGALYHMLNHSLNKSLMFFGAGNMMRAYGTKEIVQINGVGRNFPSPGRALACRCGRHYRSPAFRVVPERIHDHAGRVEAVLFLGGLPHGDPVDRDLCRVHEPFSHHVLLPGLDRPGAGRQGQRVVRRADVAGAGAVAGPWPVVAGGRSGHI